MKKVVCLYSIFYVLCALTSYVQAVSYGADGTITSVPNNFQFPASDNDNIIFPCGVVKNGFSLEDATTTCSFHSLFGVSGDIDLNGGTLILQSDFYFDNKPSTFSAGCIRGNGNAITFSSRTLLVNEDAHETVIYDAELLFSTDTTLHGTWRFAGTANVLNGQGNTITLGDDATFIVDEGSGLLLENVSLAGLADGKFYCTNDEAQLTLYNTTLVLSNNYSFTQGHLTIAKNCHIQGAYTFAYESVVSSTLTSQANLYVDSGATFKYDPVSRDQSLLVFEDNTSRLYLSAGRLHAGVGGMLLKNGSLHVDGFSYVRSDSQVQIDYVPYNLYMYADNDLTYTMTIERMKVINPGIIFGTGQSADDFFCCINKDATLYVEQDSVLSYSNADENLLRCTTGRSLLQIATGSSLNAYTSLATTEVFIAFEKGAYMSTHATAEVSAPITFKNAFLRRRLS